jgi:5-methylcytosine-specific restriction endonuclease McrA
METAHALTENLAALLRREHDALAEFLVALADFDRRRGWAELGYASLFYFLHRELHLSKGAAQYRKVAAELIEQVPAVVEPLRRGELCLTSIIEAAKVVTAENWETVLPRFYRRSKREAMEVVAALQPHPAPPVRTVITAAPPSASRAASTGALEAAPEQARSAGAPAAPGRPDELAAAPRPAALGWPDELAAAPCPAAPGWPDELAPAPCPTAPGWPDELAPAPCPAAAPRPAEVVPLSAELSRLHVTVSRRFARKLEQARDARPDATDEELLEAGLDLVLAQVAKRRGDVANPRKTPRPSKPEHIPAHVFREVWGRDGGRCQWKLANGELCGCTRRLQLDHITPLALGGTSTVDNVRILCRSHNLEAARLVFGDAWMDRYTRRAARRGEPAPRTTAPALASSANDSG